QAIIAGSQIVIQDLARSDDLGPVHLGVFQSVAKADTLRRKQRITAEMKGYASRSCADSGKFVEADGLPVSGARVPSNRERKRAAFGQHLFSGGDPSIERDPDPSCGVCHQ